MNDAILLLTKKDSWSRHAANLARAAFGEKLLCHEGTPGDALPDGITGVRFAAVLSFLSPWIITQDILENSAISLNFHPGSCDYPGIGCYNFALYEGAKEFGPVCHHMLAKVDSGVVISESLFPAFPSDTVETLKLRTMVSMLSMFHDIINLIATKKPLPVNTRQWSRRAFTRKELNALCEITPDMSEAEAQSRIRATTYPGYPGPYKLENGKKHFYPVPPGPALA